MIEAAMMRRDHYAHSHDHSMTVTSGVGERAKGQSLASLAPQPTAFNRAVSVLFVQKGCSLAPLVPLAAIHFRVID